MDLFAIDFDEKIWENYFSHSEGSLFSDEEFADMTTQADAVINNEKEDPKRRAEACVKKFQLLETRYKLAPKLLDKAQELYPDMPQTLTNIGRFYMHTKKRKKALEYFNKAAATDPQYPYAWLEKAKIENDYKDKLNFYTEFIKLKPDSKIGYEGRSRLYEDKLSDLDPREYGTTSDERFIRTIKHNYSELIRLDPSNRKHYYARRAEMNVILSQIDCSQTDGMGITSASDDAISDIGNLMLLYLTNDDYNCINIVDNLLSKMSEYISVESITDIIDRKPSDSVVYLIAQILLAIKYERSDSHEKAIEIYSKVISLMKDGDELQLYCFYNRARIYYRKKKFEKALDDYAMIVKYGSFLPKERRQSLQCSPYFARENRANIYSKTNNFTDAINEYTLLLEELDNTDEKYLVSGAYLKRAGLYLKNNESDKALADYSTVINSGISGLSNSVKEAYAARIDIYKTRGEMDKAFADYIKMSELKEEDPFGLVDLVPPKFEILD